MNCEGNVLVYRYKEAFSDTSNAIVLFRSDDDKLAFALFFEYRHEAKRSDHSRYYTKRWSIESYFR
jgi:hypothetical protein